MLSDVPDFRRHQMEVVEQPFRRRGDEPAGPDVVGQCAVGAAQDACIVVESGKDVTGVPPRARIGREARRQSKRAFFQPLDAEELVAKWFFRWCLGVPQHSPSYMALVGQL